MAQLTSMVVIDATLTAEDEEKALTLPLEGRVTRSRAKALLEATQSLVSRACTSHKTTTPPTPACFFFNVSADADAHARARLPSPALAPA